MSHRTAKIRHLRLESLPPEQAIPYVLKSLHNVLRRAMEESLRSQRIDMSFAHFAALYTLESESGIAGAEIARRCFVTAQTMNTTLRRLERDGEIERRPSPGNPRADSWSISRTGKSRLSRAKVVGDQVWAKLLSALSAAEALQLQSLLERCIVGFDVQVDEGVSDLAARSAAKTSSRVSAGRRRIGAVR